MTIFEKLSTLAEITDQEEMIKACKIFQTRNFVWLWWFLLWPITRTSNLTARFSIGKRRKSILLREKSRNLKKQANNIAKSTTERE